MELTPEMRQAAEQRGCRFTPASPEQVARLTMQRRIFTIGGAPHVATLDKAGVLETHGAIAALVAVEGQPPPRETVQEAAAADAQAALELAKENTGARSGAQVVRSGRPAGRAPRRTVTRNV